MNRNNLCKSTIGPLLSSPGPSHLIKRRTYDDEYEGNVIRDGYEPGNISPPESSNSARGDNDDESDSKADGVGEESDEAREWKESGNQAETRRKSDYGSLDDGHVWKADEA